MLKEQKVWLARIFRLIDAILVFVSFLIVHHFYYDRSLAQQLYESGTFHQAQILNVIIWVYVARRLRIYNSRRMEAFIFEMWDVGRASAAAMAAVLVPMTFFSPFSAGFEFLIYVWIAQNGLLITFRFVLRKSLRYIRSHGYNFRRVLIVGCNDRAEKLARQIENSPWLGLQILGFIDAPGRNGHSHSTDYSFNVLGTLDDLEAISRKQVIDEIFVMLPIKSFYGEIERILQFCETVGVEAKISTDLFNLNRSKSTISREFGVPVIDLYTSPKMSVQLMIKRVMDLFIALFTLILVLPVILAVSLLIKATSPGPVFFKQKRVGYNGRLFTLWKFRTMVVNADALKEELQCKNEMDGPVFKMKNDPRVTPVGRFLRKTSLDELPQLWNVLQGDMSLVGPRPPVPCEVEQYILGDRRRLSMKPGITGVWQVCGRNSIPFDQWMEMDRRYIDEWSLWLDLKILAKTVPAVFRGTGF